MGIFSKFAIHTVRFVKNLLRSARPSLALLPLCLASVAQAQFGSVNVGQTSSLTISVTPQASGTVTGVKVFTQGATATTTGGSLDFTAGGTNTCSGNLASGVPCTVAVSFTPTVPGQRVGAVVVSGAGGALGTSYLTGTGVGGLGVFSIGNLVQVAGNGLYLGSIYDGSAALSAELYLPTSVAVDGAGNYYIADSLHHRIRRVDATTGQINTICGNGNAVYGGDGGLATAATLNTPSGVALDGAGNLFIADTGDYAIRRVDAVSGMITTVAGTPGSGGNSGDGGAATSALLRQPQGVTVDAAGNLFIADTGNHVIREVVAATGIISTIAGNGYRNASDGTGGYSGDSGLATAAMLNSPYAVAFDAAGNMYIPDSANNRVRKVVAVGGAITAASTIGTFAGTGVAGFTGDGNAAALAQLYAPSGVAVDAAGNVILADTQNNAIRKVNALTGNIATMFQAQAGSAYSNSTFTAIQLYGPIGIALDGAGNFYVADSLNMMVRRMAGNFAAIQIQNAVRQGDKSGVYLKALENDGNAALDLSQITPDANSALDAMTTTCSAGATTPLAVASTCMLGTEFAPTVAGNPLGAYFAIGQTGDTANTPLSLELVGNATAVNSTTITVSSNLNPSDFGNSVTFTALVDTGANTGNLTGTVNFTEGATTLASSVKVGNQGSTSTDTTATATFTTSALAVGVHSIKATYSGDSTHFASTSSAALTQTVNEATKTKLVSSLNPAQLGASVTLTATVSPSASTGTTPDGSLTFYDGGTLLATVVLDTNGQATYTTSLLTAGVHAITATYGGDAANYMLASTSSTLSQSVQAPSSGTLTSSANPSTYGSSVTFTATLATTGSTAPTGSVVYFDGTNNLGSGTLSGNPAQATLTLTTLGVGTHSIYASYAGDSSNSSATTPTVAQVVNTTNTTTTVGAATVPGVAGASEVLTATVALSSGSGTLTGTVNFTSNGVAIGSANLAANNTASIGKAFAPGSYQIVASYVGDSNNGGSTSAAYTLVVNQAASATTVTATPNPGVVTTAITFAAKVTGTGATPGGTVTFSAGGTVLGSATLDATGVATLANSTLAVGSYTVTATYGGDTNNAASTGTAASQLVINKISTVTGVGSAISAGSPTQLILTGTVLGATGPTPTGTVTFTSGGTTLGSAAVDSTGVATITPYLISGTYTVVATYSGDANHSASTSSALSVSTPASNFIVTVTPGSASVASKQNVTVTVSLASGNSYADTIGLGCGSLPDGVNCHFTTVNLPLTANGLATTKLVIDTGNPLTSGTTASAARPSSMRTALAGILLPIAACFGLFWTGKRRRNRWLSLLLLLAVLLPLPFALSGCGSFNSTSAAPGTYTIQVTGTGAGSGEIHYGSFTLTITN